MNFGHIVGEHQIDNTPELTAHVLLSWAGVIMAATITGLALYFIYKSSKLNTRKERIKE